MSTHQAAVWHAAGQPLSIEERSTPAGPGPNELLLEVKAVALNPIDYYQRDRGIPPVAQTPSVLGQDLAGVVLAVGSAVPTDSPFRKAGARVAALAPGFYMGNDPN